MPVVGIDLGATNLRAAVSDGAGPPSAVEYRPTPEGPDGDAVMRAVVETLEAATDAADVALDTLEAVGVGSIGPLDRAAGAVVEPANLRDATRIPVREGLTDRLGRDRVFVVNDAIAGLLGERAASPDAPADLVYLTLSTGIGAGVAVDGHVLRGCEGNAAEVGHLVVDPEGRRRCGCGRRGHWEAYCGGAGIPGFARDLAGDDPATGLDLDDPAFSAADVFDAAGGDPLADRVLDRVADYNAIGVATLVQAYAPERLAIGGAVALENRSLVIDPLSEAVAEYAMLPVPAIRPAVHGRSAVLQGALALAAQGGLGE